MTDIDELREKHLHGFMSGNALDDNAVIAMRGDFKCGTLRALLDELQFLRTMKANIEAESVTCPLCEGKPLGLGEFCYAYCRDGKVLQTSANVLKNVLPAIDEADRLRREVNRLRLAQQTCATEGQPIPQIVRQTAAKIMRVGMSDEANSENSAILAEILAGGCDDGPMIQDLNAIWIAALRSAQQWRGIESAPRDGTRVLVYRKGVIAVAKFIIESNEWGVNAPDITSDRGTPFYRIGPAIWHGNELYEGPTHWMPLPADPLTATGADQ